MFIPPLQLPVPLLSQSVQADYTEMENSFVSVAEQQEDIRVFN